MKKGLLDFFRWVTIPEGVSVIFCLVLIFSQICLIFAALTSINMEGWTPDNVDKIASFIEHLATAAGIIVGGIWVYFKFFRERTYKPRLDLDIAAQLITTAQLHCVVATMKIKNAGLSKVEIDFEKSGIKVQGYSNEPPDKAIKLSDLRRLDKDVFKAFELHKKIEPNETIRDRIFFSVKKEEFSALRLEFRVFGKTGGLTENPQDLEWNDTYILTLVEKPESKLNQLLTKILES